MNVSERGNPVVLSASANCYAGGYPGGITGIFVSAASATPTITVYDSNATGTSKKIVDTFTPVAGTYYPMPFFCADGIYVVISGTVKCTVGTIGG